MCPPRIRRDKSGAAPRRAFGHTALMLRSRLKGSERLAPRPREADGAKMAERRSSFGYEDLLACGRGELFGAGNAQLPLPPMLMFDRISRDFGDRRRQRQGRGAGGIRHQADAVVLRLPLQGRPRHAGVSRPRRAVAAHGILPWLARSARPGTGAGRRRSQVRRSGASDRQESRLWRRHEARLQGQTHSGHRRRLAGGRRQAHLRRQRHAGRPVRRRRPPPPPESRARGDARSWRDWDETRRRHRHGHCVVNRQQRRGGRGQPPRRQIRNHAVGENAELGFRSQVHGAPDPGRRRGGRPPGPAVRRRRRGLESRRDGTGDRGQRASAP